MDSRTFLRLCAWLAGLALLLQIVPSLPIFSSADDHMRYYVGGYITAANLGAAPSLTADVTTILDIPDQVERGRRMAMLSPYSLVWIPQAMFFDGLWRATGAAIPLDNWTVVTAMIAGLAWMGGLFWAMRRGFPGHSLAWLIAVLTITAFIHQHTRPPDAIPRNLATFAGGVGFALALARQRVDRSAWILLALAACLHNYQQGLSTALAAGVCLLVQPRRLADTILPAAGFVLVAMMISNLVSPIAPPAPSAFLNSGGGQDWAANWEKNRVAAIQVCRYMAPLVGLLVWSLADRRRGLLAALAVVVTVVPAGILTDPGLYLGEYPNRVGGSWNCVILALLLQRDWFAAAASVAPPRRRWALAAAIAVLLVMVARMDARYLIRHRLESFRARMATIGFNYPPGSTEGAGLALMPR